MKVLIGVDGSEGGFAAAALAGALLSPERDEVLFYMAPFDLRAPRRSAVDSATLARARESLAQVVFDEAKGRLPSALAARAETLLGTQHAAHGLLVAAEESRADMIAVGARGLGVFQKLLVGSVSQAVAEHAHVPVLVVRAGAASQPGRGIRALLACDGSESSQQAARFLSRLSWPAGSQCRVMAVVESMFAGEIPQWLAEKARDADTEAMAQAWVREHEASKQALEQELRAMCNSLPSPFAGSSPLVVEGNPTEQILHAAAAEGSDLLVLGARGLGRWARLTMGSTSAKVLAHAPCSVLIVHQHEQA